MASAQVPLSNSAQLLPTWEIAADNKSCAGSQWRWSPLPGVQPRLTPILCLIPTWPEARYSCQKVWRCRADASRRCSAPTGCTLAGAEVVGRLPSPRPALGQHAGDGRPEAQAQCGAERNAAVKRSREMQPLASFAHCSGCLARPLLARPLSFVHYWGCLARPLLGMLGRRLPIVRDA
eukprot:359846-Chlamydomonas_euryale.AAC.2